MLPIVLHTSHSESSPLSNHQRQQSQRIQMKNRHYKNLPSSFATTSSTFASLSDFPLAETSEASNGVLGEPLLWGLRITSALLSYIGLVGFLDRPRGTLVAKRGIDIDILQSNVPGAGLGLFAKRNLPKGTVLGTYPGVLLKITEPNLGKVRTHPKCETYIWRFSDNQFVLDPTNDVGDLDDLCVGGSPGNPGSFFLFKNVFPFQVPTDLCRINEPPMGNDVNVVTDEDLEKRTVTFSLERDVYANEEFYIDYGKHL